MKEGGRESSNQHTEKKRWLLIIRVETGKIEGGCYSHVKERMMIKVRLMSDVYCLLFELLIVLNRSG